MKRFTSLTGIAIPFDVQNVDTDIILSAEHLKVITRTGLGKYAFAKLRTTPDNVFDQPRNVGAPILISGDNFGCGSSREHAPWALDDMGIRVIIGPSFADIFAGNSFRNGILLIELSQDKVNRLLEVATDAEITVDLDDQVVATPLGDRFPFEIDAFRKSCLLEGLDEISLTFRMEDKIAAFEASMQTLRPWVAKAAYRAA